MVGRFFFEKHTLQVWIKVMLCGGFLFGLKGAFDAMTNLPDSSGWNVCKLRLGTEGLEYMRQHHEFGDFILLDYWWFAKHKALLRYCSDMLVSGHTFVVTLFALGCYEQLRICLSEVTPSSEEHCLRCCAKQDRKAEIRRRNVIKMVALTILSVLAIVEQAAEIYFVMISRFHYTVDLATALLLTFLLYSNSAIAIVCKQFEMRGLYYFIGAWPPSKEIPKDDIKRLHAWSTQDVWTSDGDVFIPWCCIPFCSISGRAHVYNDTGILQLMYSTYCDGPGMEHNYHIDDEVVYHAAKLAQDMNLLEGVTRGEVADSTSFTANLHENFKWITHGFWKHASPMDDGVENLKERIKSKQVDAQNQSAKNWYHDHLQNPLVQRNKEQQRQPLLP
jgi:hypothetical protein